MVSDLSPSSAREMSDEQVDQVLAGLETAVESLRSDFTEVASRAERLDDDMERLLERRTAEHSASTSAVPRPRQALLSLRRRLAESAADQHREALCGLAAWWADAAVVTVMSIIQGRRPDPVRIAAPDPCSLLTAEDLERLPPIPEGDRSLAEMALAMSSGPMLPGDPPGFADMTMRHIESIGLTVKPGKGGEPTLVEDVWPEARRRRLWGPVWQEHQMPLLPETAQITEALAARGVAIETVTTIREASSAVEAQLAAKVRIVELERELNNGELSHHDATAAEAELLANVDLTERTEELVIAYARALTRSLPAIRTALQAAGE